MKKTLFAVLLVIAATIGYNANAVDGDVNGDGVVTAADVTALYNYMLNNDSSSIVNGDVDGDGNITSSDVTFIYNILLGEVPDPGLPDVTVNVVYNGNEATVTVAKNISSQMAVVVNGAHVNIVANPELQDSIIYNLSGSTNNGSFYMDGDYKCYVNLTDLTIHNPDSAAINIDNGKRIDVTLNGSNVLTDATGGAQKACCFINGHAVIAGEGRLLQR